MKDFDIKKVEFCALGRESLFKMIDALNLCENSVILLPSLICRELLAPLNQRSLVIKYYDVSKDFIPVKASDEWDFSDVVIAVNYFGFPQPLTPFKEYCSRVGAKLIEDNAHGYGGYDESGVLLGTRGDFGIFSFRKTLPLNLGGGCYSDNFNFNNNIPRKKISDKIKLLLLSSEYRKFYISKTPFVGKFIISYITNFVRLIRKQIHGNLIRPSNPEFEFNVPALKYDRDSILKLISEIDITVAKNARVEHFNYSVKVLSSFDVYIPFKTIPDGVVPYGVPFFKFGGFSNFELNLLKSKRLDVQRWPDLPVSIVPEIGSNLSYYNYLFWIIPPKY